MSMCYLSSSFSGFMIWEHLPWAIFVFCLGACVGSFINVVVHRMPAGVSLLYPPSRCPTCGGRLRFFRENLPILGWLTLRGRCRLCGVVSVPVRLIELGMAMAFLGLYVIFFWISFQIHGGARSPEMVEPSAVSPSSPRGSHRFMLAALRNDRDRCQNPTIPPIPVFITVTVDTGPCRPLAGHRHG